MRIKTVTKMFSAVLSAAMLVTSIPTALLAEPEGTAGAGEEAQEENLLKLWYDEPASQGVNILGAGAYGTTAEENNWQQHTLPIGNSFMGANVYGEITNERLTFNQKTLWNGGESAEKRPNFTNGHKEGMVELRQRIINEFLAGNDSEASRLCNQLVGVNDGRGVYQSWGDIYLTFDGMSNSDVPADYERNLDLSEAVANVDFTKDGTKYHREYFISYPDNVLAMKLTAEGDDKLALNVKFPIDNGEASEVSGITSSKLGKDVTYTVDAAEGTIVNAGSLQDNKMKLNSMLKVVTAGTVAEGEDHESLDISGADEVIIFVSADTDYKNDYPTYRSGETDAELAQSVSDVVNAAAEKGYDQVKSRHLTDYKNLFDRLSLDLGQAKSDKTTDQLLNAYVGRNGAGPASKSERALLEVLLYQFGRYLTIASSRDGDLPSNLQGVWMNRVGGEGRVPWGSDYHINVNLQMNYWPVYSSNLAECSTPLIDYIDSLREPGRVTAEKYMGIKSEAGEANGFTAHTQNTPLGWTCPGDAFSWGWSPAAVPWILQNCWEHYEYTGDLEYMRKHIYPMMKEEVLLYDQILIDSGDEITLADGTKSTRLLSAPAYSPELGPYTLGNAYEQELIWQLYEDTITAAELLDVDKDLVEQWKKIKDRLAPVEIGDSGQIKEWYDETTIGSIQVMTNHRHMSHLLALYPGDYISVENEELIDAAVVSLKDRGYNSTGWGMGQRINAWARTGDGEQTYVLINNLFSGGIYPNLWDTHAPFQIDGNFGYTSGVNEMLMQSNVGYINILPAIPSAWDSGSVDGIVTRGNFELQIDWEDGAATFVEVLSRNGGECVMQHGGIENAVIKDSKGNVVTTEKVTDNRISFATEKGETYTITGFSSLKAPTGALAVNKDGNIVLTWDAVEGAASYNIYRKGSANYEKIGTAEGLTYTDEGRMDFAEAEKYRVAAVSESGKEGKRSDAIKVLPSIQWVDDRDASITYEGNWETFTHSKNYGGAIKFIQTLEGNESIEMSFTGTGIDVITSKNAGYGEFKVYIDDEEVGTANCSASSSLSQQVTFSSDELTFGKHTIKLTTEGQAGRKIEFDAFKVYISAAPQINVTYDLGRAADSGSAPAAQKAEAGSTITLPACTAAVAGYQFAGWSDGKKTYAVGSQYKLLSADMTFTAVWDRETQNVTGIETSSSLTLDPGESTTLQVTVSPANASEEDLIYASNDISTVIVSPHGVVTASKYKSGSAVITIKSADGSVSKECTVTVNPPAEVAVTDIRLEKERIVLKKEDTTSLAATVTPYFGTDKTVTWTADDTSVVEINDGTITGLKEGKAVVTASINGKSASCEVYVVENTNVTGRQELNFTLQTLKDLAEKYGADNYKDAIAEAEKRLDYGDAILQSEVNESMEEFKGAEENIPKDAFNGLLQDANAMDLEGYTEESVTVFKNALRDANAVKNDADASLEVIQKTIDTLKTAMSGLVPDKTTLAGKITEAEQKDLSSYTADSVSEFKKAIETAKDILNDSSATKKSIQDALKALNDALQKLVPVSGGSGGPGGSGDPGTVNTVPALDSVIEDANFTYRVTKSDAVNGTATVTGLTAAGKKKTKLTIPATAVKDNYTFKVTAIDKKAFQKNKKLKNVVIGVNVTSIGANSFNKCSKLANIRFMSTKAPASVGKNAFKGIKSKCKIYYPKKMKRAQLKKLKKKMKSAGKKVVYKKK